MKYRKKPVVIDAFQLKSGILLTDIYSFFGVFSDDDFKPFDFVDDKIIIKTLEGDMTAIQGDYIIKGIKGEFYPCKPDIFEQTYDKADGDDKEEYFMVYVVGKNSPTQLHNEIETAESEAIRLTQKERTTTFVLKAVSKFELNEVKKTIL